MSTSNLDRYDLGLPGGLDANIRENLSNAITMTSPTETPFQNMISMPSSTGAQFDWLREELNDVDSDNALVDGADAGTDDSKKGDRLRNVCQISGKVVRISGRAQSENTPADISSLARQIVRRGMDLRRDMESILTGNQASVQGDSTTAARTGTLRAWFETNTELGAGGINGGYNVATGNVDAATDGAPEALSQVKLNNVIEGAWTEGGYPSVLMESPAMKTRISDFLIASSDAKVGVIRSNIDGNAAEAQVVATQSVDIYKHDFGTLEIIPNRFQRDRDVFVLDPDMWQCKKFRDFRLNQLAKTGDADNRQLIVDYGLCSLNEKASGLIADVDHTTPMVA